MDAERAMQIAMMPAPDPNLLAIRKQERAIEVLDLAKKGMKPWEIARELNITLGEASRALKAILTSLSKRRTASSENYRQMLIERVEMAMAAIADRVIAGDLEAVAEWRQLVGEAAKLGGLLKVAPQVNVVNQIAVGEAAQAMFGIRSTVEDYAGSRVPIDESPRPTPALPAPLAE